MKVKYFTNFNKLKLKKNSVIVIDNFKDEELLILKGFEVFNINKIHYSYPLMKNGKKLEYINEMEKIFKIASFLNKDLDETVIEITNFITEVDLYKIKNLDKEKFVYKNLLTILDIKKKYEEYKKNENKYDMVDALAYSTSFKGLLKNKEVYLYNSYYLDPLRKEIINNLIEDCSEFYILKEKGVSFSIYESFLLDRQNEKRKFKASKIELDTKISILNFLKQEKDKNIAIYIQGEDFSHLIKPLQYKEINLFLSIVNIFEGNFDNLDIDNLFVYFNLDRNILLEKDFSKKDLIEIEELKNIFNLDFSNLKLFFINLHKILKFDFILKIVEFINNKEDNLCFKLKMIINLHLEKEMKLNFCGIPVISKSSIKEFDKVYFLNSSIKPTKISYLSDFHRKQLKLVDSELYKKLQLDIIESILEFDNVVLLDYKYEINEIKEDIFKFDLKEEIPTKNKIEKLQLFKKGEYLHKIERIEIHDLIPCLQTEEINYNLEFDYLLKSNADFYIKKYLDEGFEHCKYKSRILLLKNQIKNITINGIVNKEEFCFDMYIKELNKTITITYTPDRIKDKTLIFYRKEPFTWKEDYHPKKLLEKLGFEVIYLGLF